MADEIDAASLADRERHALAARASAAAAAIPPGRALCRDCRDPVPMARRIDGAQTCGGCE